MAIFVFIMVLLKRLLKDGAVSLAESIIFSTEVDSFTGRSYQG